jgi:hypothetical protein
VPVYPALGAPYLACFLARCGKYNGCNGPSEKAQDSHNSLYLG